ncbi:restriction endonuclease subunit S [Acinetobacter towneri]|uniref:restriction endonuclease subunit S n=1 Tax=Acinetobacter towneri TaxID=202956 RepID=UPI001AA01D9F|nr:restriction endonuclease subunit S [Acinetobacter towneri]QTD63471.1 restriction endonuclease subunit S [Acinetobacter towneri]
MSFEWVNFVDVVDCFDSVRVPLSTKERLNLSKKYPYYGAQGIIDYVDDYLFDGEYILLAEDGENLRSKKQPISQLASGKFWVNNHAHIYQAKRFTSNLYICAALNYVDINPFITGAAQPKLSQNSLKYLKIPFPDFKTQQFICLILGSIEKKILILTKLCNEYEKLINKIYQEWFVNFKFPNHEQVESVDGIPKGWVRKSIFESYEILSGGTPKTTNPQYWDNGKIPFFTPKDATDSYFVNETEKYITEQGLSKCNSKLYDENTIFITARGTVGKISIPMRPMAMNQSCYALKPKADLCFYYSFLNIEDAINKIKQNANGGVFDAIVVDTFKQIDVLVPHMEIQVQFENLVQPMFEQIKNLLKQNEHLLDLKHTLLPRLMSGELDVSKLSSIE